MEKAHILQEVALKSQLNGMARKILDKVGPFDYTQFITGKDNLIELEWKEINSVLSFTVNKDLHYNIKYVGTVELVTGLRKGSQSSKGYVSINKVIVSYKF